MPQTSSTAIDLLFWYLVIWSLGFVSDFGFRASNLISDLSLIFKALFELIVNIALDKATRPCHGHHKPYALEVYDGPENRKSRHHTAYHCDSYENGC
jgi:hypothetical protein